MLNIIQQANEILSDDVSIKELNTEDLIELKKLIAKYNIMEMKDLAYGQHIIENKVVRILGGYSGLLKNDGVKFNAEDFESE